MGNLVIVNILTRKRDYMTKTCERVLVAIAIVLAHCHYCYLAAHTSLPLTTRVKYEYIVFSHIMLIKARIELCND